MSDKAVEMILRIKDELFKKGLSGAEKQLNAFGKKFEDVGQKAALGFAGLTASLGVVVGAAANFQATMLDVSKVTGISGANLQDLGKKLQDLSTTMPKTAQELGQIAYSAGQLGIGAGKGVAEAQQEILGFTTAVAKISSALDFEADFTGTAMARIANAFRIPVPEIENMGSAINEMSATSSASAAEIVTGIQSSAAVLGNQIGVAQQDMAGLIASMVEIVGSGEQAGTALERFFTNSAVNIGKVAQAIGANTAELGTLFQTDPTAYFIRVQEGFMNMNSSIQRTTMATQLFGKEGARAILGNATAVDKLKGYLDVSRNAYEENISITEELDRVNTGFLAQLKIMGNTFVAAFQPIGDSILPELTQLTKALKGVADWLRELPAPAQKAIGVTALLATAALGLVAGVALLGSTTLSAVASMTGFINLLKNAPAMFASAQAGAAALGATLGVSTGGLTLIIGGIVTALAALAIAWQNDFMGIQTFTKQVVTFLKIVFQDFVNFVEPAFKAIGEAVRKWAKDVHTGVSGFFKGLMDIGSKMLDGLIGIAKGFMDIIAKAVQFWVNFQIQSLRKLVDGANWVLDKLGQPKIPIDSMLTNIKAVTNTAIDYVQNRWSKAGSAIQKTIAQAAQAAQQSAAKTGSPNQAGSYTPTGDDKKKKEKKVKDTTEKDQIHDLQRVADELTRSLNGNKFALDETIAGMGAYAEEGVKLSEQLIKLKNDETDLIAVRNHLASITMKGKAEEHRIKQLADMNEKIRQNAIDQRNIENDLTRHGAEAYKKRLDDWARLNDMKTQIAQKSAQMQSDYLKKQEDHELENLKRLLNQKKITRDDYLKQTTAIVEAQAQREIGLIQTQIKTLADKKAAMEAINGTTADTLELGGQIEQLEMRVKEILLGQKIYLEGTKQSVETTKTFMTDFLTTMGNLSNQFATNFVTSILQGNASIGDSFKALGIQATQAMVNGLFNRIGKGFMDSIKDGKTMTDTLTKGFDAFAKASSSIFKGLWDLVGTVFSGIVSFAVSAFKKMFSVSKSANVGAATTKVGEWAINAAAAVAGIPIIGPALAKAAYASAMGMGMATVAGMKAANMASFAVGTPDITSDMVANVHEGEMIIPKSFASAIRSGELSLSGGGGQSAGNGATVHISFEGANFMGLPQDMIDEIERRLIEKKNILGSALFGGA